MSSIFIIYVDKQDEYDNVSKIVLQAKKSADFPIMHMNQRIGTLISRNESGDIYNALKIFRFNCDYDIKIPIKYIRKQTPFDFAYGNIGNKSIDKFLLVIYVFNI